ncbi:MAG: hypothetical protein NTW55_08460 [Planctomycetota bacterium]|nr:hypothetical protein [Planctomycetota bacterium]
MNTQQEFLKKTIEALKGAGIQYMISGSIGSSFYGWPRATKDADIVIVATDKQLCDFAKSLGEDYYFSLEAARDALKHNSMFNVIDIQASWKADLIIRKNRPFSREEFQRRQKVKMYGTDVWVLSPEDAILSKLEWSKDIESKQQFQDALGIAIVHMEQLDMDYLNKWAKELGIESSLQKLLKASKKSKNGK